MKETCPECEAELTDVTYGEGLVLQHAYCDMCNKIVVDNSYFPDKKAGIVEYSCLGILIAIGSIIVYGAVMAFIGG